MTKIVGNFVLDVKSFEEKTQKSLTQFQRDFFRLLADKLVRETPVITGELRGSWGVSVGVSPVVSHAAKNEPGGGARYTPGPLTVARLGSLTDLAQPGDAVWFYNVAPYAAAVEYGTARFAGRAYVRNTLAAAPALAEEAAQ